MDFPLYVHTYELNGRIYRRNPYGGFRSDEEAELRGGDTADLYADDEYDDGPYAAQLTCEMESSKPESKKEGTAPVETVGPPPGFETCAVEGKIASDDSLSSNTGCAESGSSATDGTVQRASAQEDVREEVAIKFDPRSKKWSTRLEVPYEMIRFVIGAKGSMKRKLELETDCRLVFPDREKKAKYVEIISTKSQESIERCRDRIELMLMSTRERSAFTHFVSIPMNSADIQSAFSQFAELIQNDDDLPASCREPAAFQEVGKLHLTVVMLSLFDETEIGKATSALEAVVKNRV
ncbi:unnamed protein product, partial [Toxocara canis]|uniref:KH domain-containing protein n=1 Tax=Toxocara canis TaxID=6265 RepID=A0A183VGE4_TOXCA